MTLKKLKIDEMFMVIDGDHPHWEPMMEEFVFEDDSFREFRGVFRSVGDDQFYLIHWRVVDTGTLTPKVEFNRFVKIKGFDGDSFHF